MLHLLALIAALLFTPPHGSTSSPFHGSTSSPFEAKPDCRQIEALTGGVELEWLDDGNGYGYWDLPADLKLADKIDFAEGGILEYKSKSQPGTRWLWWFGDYEATTDANGEHLGNHHFCAILLVDK